MKHLLFALLVFIACTTMSAQKIEPIKLNAPDKTRGSAVMKAFADRHSEGTRLTGATDGGIVSQNISLFCAGIGLATVPRGSMNKEGLVKALNLSSTCLLVLNQPVGYPETTEDKNTFTFNVGQFKLSTLAEKMGAGNPKILIGATPEQIQKYLPDGFQSQVNAFLLQTPDKNILIDAGLGRGDLLKSLKSLNAAPEQINVILLTHMHGDHIGGLLDDGKKVFPNADLYLSRPEYDYWIKSDNKSARTVLEAYKSRLKLFQPEALGSKKQNIFSGVQGIAAYGHTPGHTAFLLESGASRLLVWGDLTHVTAVQMPHPELAVTYDSDAKQAIASRKKILEYVAKNQIPVAGMHLASPAVGNVKVEGQGYVFDVGENN